MKSKNQPLDKKAQIKNQLLDISLILVFFLFLPFILLLISKIYNGEYQSIYLIHCIAGLCYLIIALFAKKLSWRFRFYSIIIIWCIACITTLLSDMNFSLLQKWIVFVVLTGILIFVVKIFQNKCLLFISTVAKQEPDLSILHSHQKECETQQTEKQIDLSQKLIALEKLAGGMAHDFNNLLMPIMGYTEMMLEDFSDHQEAVDSLNEILKTLIRAKNLTQQALIFSKRSIIHHEPVDLVSIMDETIPLLRETIPHSIEIKKHIESENNYVMGDPSQLQIIIMHLCTNASHAIDNANGCISISISKKHVDELISFNGDNLKSGNFIVLSVADNGSGIDIESQTCIFDPYFSTKDKGKGKGLGLSIVLGIVSRLNGGITFESTIDKGTCFEIFFPALEADNDTTDKS
jgi:signal transduction histidine kinase